MVDVVGVAAPYVAPPTASGIGTDLFNLYDHQRRAVEVLERRGGNGAIWLPMRTGKTRAALAFLHGRSQRTLIVCPLSVASVWEREAGVTVGTYGSVILQAGYGRIMERAQLIKELAKSTSQPVVV